jgi:hypothetical protein
MGVLWEEKKGSKWKKIEENCLKMILFEEKEKKKIQHFHSGKSNALLSHG